MMHGQRDKMHHWTMAGRDSGSNPTFWIRTSCGGCQVDQVPQEWQLLKTIVRTTFKDKSYLGLWQTLLTKEPYCSDLDIFGQLMTFFKSQTHVYTCKNNFLLMFQTILHLGEMLLVLPISAAQCERGFSAQNHIKNSTRSSLHVSTTEDLIRISTEGCSLEAKWLSSSKRTRRPLLKQWPADM
ncbi:hypothetical protein ILYODFUR_031680 [Ilyodon furcidens]|uniref:HAT C-terminal dimerisation domain-containing protein n=1 Tax=Ilyodon furcidens TaxID=33524 RepID=A0ABV0UD36_9TELE